MCVYIYIFTLDIVYMEGERRESVYYFYMLQYRSRLKFGSFCVLHVKDISCISFMFFTDINIYIFIDIIDIYYDYYIYILYITHLLNPFYACIHPTFFLSKSTLLAPWRGGGDPAQQAEKTHMFESCLRFCFRGGFAYRAGSVRRV